jgi:hypothetical protein
MNAIPEVQCGWCKKPATDPSTWLHFGKKQWPLCLACSLNIKQVLKAGNHLARMVGQKLRER